MQAANRVVKNTGILYAKMGITMFISLYTTRLLLNALGVSDFGIFNIVGGAIAMLGFLDSAMSSATQRFMSYSEGEGDKEKQKKIFNTSIILHLGIAVVLAIVLLIAGYFFFNGVLNIAPARVYAAKIVYASLIVSTIFTVITVPYDAVLNAHENMLYYAIVGVVESLLKLGIALTVVYMAGDKLVIYGMLMACIPLVTMTFMRIYCHRKYAECKIALKKYWDKDLMKQMTGFAGWNLTSTSTSMVGNYGVGLLLNHFFGTVLNASFGIASQLNGQLVTFSNNMSKALNPAIVKAEGEGNRKNMLTLSLIGCKFSFFLFSFFAIPFLLETPIILRLWLNNVPDYAISFCRLALLRTLIEQLTRPLNTALGAQGQIRSYTIFKSLLFLIPLPLIYFLFAKGLPAYTMLIVTLFVGGILDGLISLFFAMVKCGLVFSQYFDFVLKKVFFVFCISFIVGILPSFLMQESFFRLSVVLATSLISFLLMFYSVGLTDDEKIGINILIIKIKIKIRILA